MKRFPFLCCLVLLLSMLFPVGHALAEEGVATETDQCSHAWLYDENGHYCSQCGSEAEKIEHTFETQCMDVSGHYDVCTVCGYTTDVSSHWESCANPGVCKKCGYEGDIKKVRHKKNKIWISDGAAGCYSACSGCNRRESETIDHEASCIDTAHCAYCGYEGAIQHIIHNGKYSFIDEKTCGFQCSDCGEQIIQEHCASCEQPGICLDCGYAGEIARKYHPAGQWVYDEVSHYFECPTCGKFDEGTHFGTCVDSTHCGYCGKEGEFNDGEHIWDKVEHDAQWHWFTCIECKQNIKEEHSWGEPTIVDATETTDGSRTYACNCGETKVEVIPAIGSSQCSHEEVTWVADGAKGCCPVCTVCNTQVSELYEHEALCTDTTRCAYCGYEGAIQSFIHDGEYSPIDEKACGFLCNACGKQVIQPHRASCVEPTLCTYCGYEGEIKSIYHQGGEMSPIDEKTCGYLCSACGEMAREYHWASCDDPTHCMYCSYEGAIKNIYHPEGYWVYDETEHYLECPSCGAIAHKGKHFGTCIDSTRCFNCGIEGEFSQGEHMWEGIDHDAEYHWYTCTECGEDIKESHRWDEPAVVEATNTENGSKTYTCECGEVKVEVIPATGNGAASAHTHILDAFVPIGSGAHIQTCAECGKTVASSCTMVDARITNLDISSCIYCGFITWKQDNITDGTQDGKAVTNAAFTLVDEAGAAMETNNLSLLVYESVPQATLQLDTGASVVLQKALTIAVLEDNTPVKLAYAVKLTIPMTGDLTGLKLLAMDESGNLAEIAYEVADGVMVFETRVLGIFMLVEEI